MMQTFLRDMVQSNIITIMFVEDDNHFYLPGGSVW